MKIGPEIRKRQKGPMKWQKEEDTPMLAASLKGRLALVYPDTLMLAPYSPHSPINTPTPNFEKKKSCRKIYEKI